ncbi:acireductone dioxygenase [Pseudomonas sp. R5(2019)]|uniref:1,2-dihydroxy-3-keto-5-methylthiopentene dioxygenase n=1 Tax=Pseudomonas sp. R5(2019) TaxID=2697566 RepID=UPI00141225CA|nr:acireductone dioxygenase [Pseudomonas sp. R5(2019)]NBA97297.1 acireductone dioxygenase [Pseudomonas sp. R5(2019)]
MSSLSVYHLSTPDIPNKVLTHVEDIASTLAEHGVRFERWQATTPIKPGASQQEVIAAYQGQIDQWMTEGGYRNVEVISVHGEQPQKAELRAEHLEEQRHGKDEIRLFVAGRGLLNLHIEDYVYAVLCEKHDLISVPAGTVHWLDVGEDPRVVVIRLFNDAEGGVENFTSEDIASRFPGLDD